MAGRRNEPCTIPVVVKGEGGSQQGEIDAPIIITTADLTPPTDYLFTATIAQVSSALCRRLILDLSHHMAFSTSLT
jgi:hypothetical protein